MNAFMWLALYVMLGFVFGITVLAMVEPYMVRDVRAGDDVPVTKVVFLIVVGWPIVWCILVYYLFKHGIEKLHER